MYKVSKIDSLKSDIKNKTREMRKRRSTLSNERYTPKNNSKNTYTCKLGFGNTSKIVKNKNN
jgi:hypothetical protein